MYRKISKKIAALKEQQAALQTMEPTEGGTSRAPEGGKVADEDDSSFGSAEAFGRDYRSIMRVFVKVEKGEPPIKKSRATSSGKECTS